MIFKDIIRKKTSLLWISEEKISLRIDFKQLFLNWFKKKSIFRFSSNSVLNYRKRKISNKIISEHKSSNLGSQIEFSLVLDEYTGQNFKIPKNSEISKILSFREAFSFNIYQSISKITPFFQSYEKDGLDFFSTFEKTRIVVFQDSNNKNIRKTRLCFIKIFKKRLLWSTFSFLAKKVFKKKKIFNKPKSFLKFKSPYLLFFT